LQIQVSNGAAPGLQGMHVPLLFCPVVLFLFADPQDPPRDVVPGREYHVTKVLTPGQTDRWKVGAKADEVLKCRVSATDLDPVLDLVDEAGRVLASNDGEGSQSYVQYRIAEPGKVEFRVRGFQGAGGGRYEFSLERYTAPRLAVGAETSGTFAREQWSHVRLDLEAGECFVPVVDGGRLTAVMQFATNTSIGENLGAYTAPQKGEYHLRVEGPEKQPFRLRTLRPVRREAVAGERLQVSAAPFGLDVVRMKLPAGVASRIDFAMPDVQLRSWYRLLGEDPKWRELGGARKGALSRFLFQPERDLEVELWLRNVEDREAHYELRVGVGDQPLAASGATEGTLLLCGIGCHTLPVRAGDVVMLRTVSDAFDAAMVVCAPDGTPFAAVDDAGPLDRNPEFTFCAPRTGTYRVLSHACGHTGSGAYRIEVTRHEVPVLGFDRPLELHVENGRDAHARLQLAAGQEVWLSAKSRDVDVALSIDDGAGQRLGTWEGGGVDGNVLGAFRASQAGTFTLFVHSRRGAGRCQLRALVVE